MLGAFLIGGKARVIEDIGPAPQFEEGCPLPVIIGDNRNKAVLGRIGPAARVYRPRIAHAAITGNEGFTPKIFHHVEPGEAFEHRHLDKLAALSACPAKQRRHGCIGREQAADLVGDKAWGISGPSAIALRA